MELVTVFTPTYNRKNLLGRLYDSLLRQTCKDFLWMVIDDGSNDGTKEYIEALQKNTTEFRVEYYYKENGGLHTGYNLAISKLNTELCLCCDSDDWLSDDCIELVNKEWQKNKKENCAGIIGLDFFPNGKVVGQPLPAAGYFDLNELYIHGKLMGDKKVVVRSELYKQQPPMKTINGEKNFNPNYYNVVISEKYCWIALNKNLCFVEYQESGMANNIYRQYNNSPNSFIELRKLYLSLHGATLKFKIRHLIHYQAECILAKRKREILSSGQSKLLSVAVLPVSMLLYCYIKYKAKKH